jgi:hypothetical protein
VQALHADHGSDLCLGRFVIKALVCEYKRSLWDIRPVVIRNSVCERTSVCD